MINKDAIIIYKNHGIFWQTVNGGSSLDEEIAKNNVKCSGSNVALELFRKKCIKSSNANNTVTKPSHLSTNFSKTNQNTNANTISSSVSNNNQPLKSGWLLKKRDIFSGWRCRYFVVYMGRVEYFKDQHDLVPRGVIQIVNAEVHPAKRVNVHNVGEYWGIL